MKTIFILIPLSFVVLKSNCQQYFSKLYGEEEVETAFSMEKCNNGYFLLGRTTSFNDSNGDVYLVKVDSLGNELFNVSWGNEERNNCFKIKNTSDNCYILCGSNTLPSFDSDEMVLRKINEQGELIWQQTFLENPYRNLLLDVEETVDKEFITIGVVGQNFDEDLIILKTDSLGNQLSSNILDFGDRDIFYQIERNNSNEFFVGGLIRNDNNQDISICKLNPQGDTLWVKTYPDTNFIDEATSIDVVDNNELIILGRSYNEDESGFKLIKINSDGLVIWQSYFPINNNFRPNHILNTEDGGFLVVGRIGTDNQIRAIIYKTDSNGQVIWEQDFPGANYSNIQEALEENNGFLLFGDSDEKVDEKQNLKLIKINKEGQLTRTLFNNQKHQESIIYPNPTNQFIHLNISQNFKGIINISDTNGKVIRKVECNNQNELNLSLEHFENGVYFISFEGNLYFPTKKIIKSE